MFSLHSPVEIAGAVQRKKASPELKTLPKIGIWNSVASTAGAKSRTRKPFKKLQTSSSGSRVLGINGTENRVKNVSCETVYAKL
jgi:hypothetical protein